MDSHSRVRRWEAALGCFHREGGQRGTRNVFEFNCALQACALGAKPGWAVALLRDLRQSGHEADAVSWSTVLTASRCHWKLTMGLLTQLRREVAWCRETAMATESDQACGVRADVSASLRSYLSATNAALASCALHRRWQHSVDLLEALGRFAAQPSPRTYTTCFSALGAGGNPWQLTFRLLSVGCHQSSLRDASLLADAAARSAARRSEPRQNPLKRLTANVIHAMTCLVRNGRFLWCCWVRSGGALFKMRHCHLALTWLCLRAEHMERPASRPVNFGPRPRLDCIAEASPLEADFRMAHALTVEGTIPPCDVPKHCILFVPQKCGP